jgi:hypothetical protein
MAVARTGASKMIVLSEEDRGVVYLRTGFTLAFFLPSPIADVVSPLTDAFQALLKSLPKDVFQWQTVGANSDEWSPIGATTMGRCRAQLDSRAAAKRKLTSFALKDTPGASGYAIKVLGGTADPKFPDKRTLFEVQYPGELLESEGAAGIAERAKALGALLPYVSGYGSPALHWAELMQGRAMVKARAFAKRYPGYDVSNNSGARRWINDKVRGARWLTFLGPKLFKSLGGRAALATSLRGSNFTIEAVGHGLMIRAGDEPEVGDVNKKIGTPLLRKLAKVLEPVTMFREPALSECEFFEGLNDPFVNKWERRFLD